MLTTSGTWLQTITDDGEVIKEQSMAKFCALVENDARLYKTLRQQCFAAAKITYRHK